MLGTPGYGAAAQARGPPWKTISANTLSIDEHTLYEVLQNDFMLTWLILSCIILLYIFQCIHKIEMFPSRSLDEKNKKTVVITLLITQGSVDVFLVQTLKEVAVTS